MWPVGQHTIGPMPLLAGREETGWTVFKLAAAEWYLKTLEALFSEIGDLDRYFGVELALDGFLAAVSSSFDASVARLIDALETSYPDAKKTAPHRYSWSRCKSLSVAESFALQGEADVDAALAGEADDVPSGWLAVARRLRNRSTHHSTLSRHFSQSFTDVIGSGLSTSDSTPTMLSLPGGRAEDPIRWCQQTLDESRELAQVMSLDLQRVLSAKGR